MCCNVSSVEGRALGVSDQEYLIVCVAMYRVLEAEPLVYLIKIIQGQGAGVHALLCIVLCTM